MMIKSPYGLVFFCSNPEYKPTYKPSDPRSLQTQLQTGGFLGELFEIKQETGFLIGADFLKLITFLGCSPQLEITPPDKDNDWRNFCYIEIENHQKHYFYKGLKPYKCSCPACKSRVSQILPEMEQWSPDKHWVLCPKCHKETLVEKLNWRHGAGFGQFFIVIRSVYPHEAVPTDQMLKLLQLCSDESWDYFYFQH